MKKLLSLTLPIFVFIPTFLYLHLKVQIYVEGYRLSNNYRCYNELLDERDFLMQGFAKEVSLARVNRWAQSHNFSLVDKGRVFALNTETQKSIPDNKIALLFDRFLNASTSTSVAMAEEKQ